MRKPYIGITDFMHADQARDMLDLFIEQGGMAQGRRLMVGVMMSYKTLHDLPTKWTDAFPKKEDIAGIFIEHDAAMHTLHYADYDGIDVAASLELATSFGGPTMHALQLDMIWPDPAVVRAYHERHPLIEIVLQANAKALDLLGNDPDALLAKLGEYGLAIDHVLLDKSMGKGLGMDAVALEPFAKAIACFRPDLGIAAAGGLGPDTLRLVEPLVSRFRGLSIDAQGKLRASGNALDPIDWDRARDYVTRSIAMFGRHQRPAS